MAIKPNRSRFFLIRSASVYVRHANAVKTGTARIQEASGRVEIMVRGLLGKRPAGQRDTAPRRWRASPNRRCYAIGDVHGCLAELDVLLHAIEADMAARAPKETHIVFLGDLVDRGPESRGVVERVRALADGDLSVLLIKGNHEEMLLRGLSGEPELLPKWLDYGGRACMASYGVPVSSLEGEAPETLEAVFHQAIPRAHLDFLDAGLDQIRFGDYLLVHAGVRPGLPLDRQSPRDLRWIRDEFLSSTADFGACIIHGHSIEPEIVIRPNRIGIDTGAYETGILSAVRLEDEEVEVLQARPLDSHGA